MSIFVISDLHLSFSSDKPMDIYGERWVNHTQRVSENWRKTVSDTDIVIIGGDISWALKMEDADLDLNWISSLPGKKILVKGNHDLWWSSISKLRAAYKELFFIQNNFYDAGDCFICGTRGWICPGDSEFDEHDQKIYNREILRLRSSLDAAKSENKTKDILVSLHFPPTNDTFESSGFTDLCEEYGVSVVTYGHLHSENAFQNGIQGVFNDVTYHLTSCDYLRCELKKIR